MSEEKDQPQAVEHHDYLHLKTLVETYGVKVSTVALILIVAITAVLVIQKRKETMAADASIRLSQARTLSEIEALNSEFATTPIAPFALLKEAKAHFSSGNYSTAVTKYKEFEERFPGHEFQPAATLGAIHCREALAQLEDALTGYNRFIDAHRDHYLTPQASFGKARCLEQLGRMDEARIVYEDFINSNEESAWRANAEELLERVNKRIARGDTAPMAFPAGPRAGANSFLSMPPTTLDSVPVLAGPEPVSTNALR